MYLVPVLFTFYIQGVLKLKNNSGAKRLTRADCSRSENVKNILFISVVLFPKYFLITKSGKGKAVLLLAWSSPEGSRKLMFRSTWQRHRMVVRLSALRTGRLYPQEVLLVPFLLEAESTPGPLCDQKEFMSMKNPLTPGGIEPATFRFVAQPLNHCATAVPN
jgi:hypothetical protein